MSNKSVEPQDQSPPMSLPAAAKEPPKNPLSDLIQRKWSETFSKEKEGMQKGAYFNIAIAAVIVDPFSTDEFFSEMIEQGLHNEVIEDMNEKLTSLKTKIQDARKSATSLDDFVDKVVKLIDEEINKTQENEDVDSFEYNYIKLLSQTKEHVQNGIKPYYKNEKLAELDKGRSLGDKMILRAFIDRPSTEVKAYFHLPSEKKEGRFWPSGTGLKQLFIRVFSKVLPETQNVKELISLVGQLNQVDAMTANELENFKDRLSKSNARFPECFSKKNLLKNLDVLQEQKAEIENGMHQGEFIKKRVDTISSHETAIPVEELSKIAAHESVQPEAAFFDEVWNKYFDRHMVKELTPSKLQQVESVDDFRKILEIYWKACGENKEKALELMAGCYKLEILKSAIEKESGQSLMSYENFYEDIFRVDDPDKFHQYKTLFFQYRETIPSKKRENLKGQLQPWLELLRPLKQQDKGLHEIFYKNFLIDNFDKKEFIANIKGEGRKTEKLSIYIEFFTEMPNHTGNYETYSAFKKQARDLIHKKTDEIRQNKELDTTREDQNVKENFLLFTERLLEVFDEEVPYFNERIPEMADPARPIAEKFILQAIVQEPSKEVRKALGLTTKNAQKREVVVDRQVTEEVKLREINELKALLKDVEKKDVKRLDQIKKAIEDGYFSVVSKSRLLQSIDVLLEGKKKLERMSSGVAFGQNELRGLLLQRANRFYVEDRGCGFLKKYLIDKFDDLAFSVLSNQEMLKKQGCLDSEMIQIVSSIYAEKSPEKTPEGFAKYLAACFLQSAKDKEDEYIASLFLMVGDKESDRSKALYHFKKELILERIRKDDPSLDEVLEQIKAIDGVVINKGFPTEESTLSEVYKEVLVRVFERSVEKEKNAQQRNDAIATQEKIKDIFFQRGIEFDFVKCKGDFLHSEISKIETVDDLNKLAHQMFLFKEELLKDHITMTYDEKVERMNGVLIAIYEICMKFSDKDVQSLKEEVYTQLEKDGQLFALNRFVARDKFLEGRIRKDQNEKEFHREVFPTEPLRQQTLSTTLEKEVQRWDLTKIVQEHPELIAALHTKKDVEALAVAKPVIEALGKVTITATDLLTTEALRGAFTAGRLGDSSGDPHEFCRDTQTVLKHWGEENGVKERLLKGELHFTDDTLFTLIAYETLAIFFKHHDTKKPVSLPVLVYLMSKNFLEYTSERVEQDPSNQYARNHGAQVASSIFGLHKQPLACMRQEYNKTGGGCGPAMYLSVLGLFFPGEKNREALVKMALAFGAITHRHPMGYLGAIPPALFTAMALEDKPFGEWIKELQKQLDSPGVKNLVKAYAGDSKSEEAGTGYADFKEAYRYYQNQVFYRWLMEPGFPAGIRIEMIRDERSAVDAEQTCLAQDKVRRLFAYGEAAYPWNGEEASKERFEKDSYGWSGSSGHDASIMSFHYVLMAIQELFPKDDILSKKPSEAKAAFEKLSRDKQEEVYEHFLIYSSQNGGDSDTTGAIAGQLFGAIFGHSHLPEKYRKAGNTCMPAIQFPLSPPSISAKKE